MFQVVVLGCVVAKKNSKTRLQVIQAVTFSSPIVGLVTNNPLSSGHVNSPSQKGHELNHQVQIFPQLEKLQNFTQINPKGSLIDTP